LHLSACVSLRRCDALDVEPPAAPGVLATNPPYGVRLGDQRVLAAFYPKFGDLLKQRFAGWRCYVFTAERDLPGLVRLRESKRTPLYNGAIECRLFEFRMVSGRLKERAATT
jgi:putative N6-adenine-specific DNA methylase